MAATAAAAGPRARTYAALARRNRFVGRLRVLVPVVGVVAFAVLVVQMVIGNMALEFSIGRVTIDRNRLTVETPTYSGVMADGASYSITAGTASAALDNPTMIELGDTSLFLRRATGVEVTAFASTARLDTQNQVVDVPGLTEVGDSSGLRATVYGLHVDGPGETARTSGPVRIAFGTGQVVEAETLGYDATTGLWQMTGVRLVLPDLPAMEGTTP